MIFQKNFMSSIVIIIIFTQINIKYQQLFNQNQLIGLSDEEALKVMETNLNEFQSQVMLGQITSFSCMMSVIGQFVFNSRSKFKVPFDKWAVLDFGNAITNNICFGMFSTLKAEDIMQPDTKEIFNWI